MSNGLDSLLKLRGNLSKKDSFTGIGSEQLDAAMDRQIANFLEK
jgi:hypothetical protein